MLAVILCSTLTSINIVLMLPIMFIYMCEREKYTFQLFRTFN